VPGSTVETGTDPTATIDAETVVRATPPDVLPDPDPEPDPDPAPDLEIDLFDASTDAAIAPVKDGAEIALSSFEDLTVAAAVPADSPLSGRVESMRVTLNDGEFVAVENVEPYALFGDARGDFYGGTLKRGTNEVTFEQYSESNAGGQLLATTSRTFALVDPIKPESAVIARINAGGPAVAASDGGPA